MSMKKVKYLVMTAILVVTSMMCPGPTFANSLNNPGFEYGDTTGWSTSGGGTLTASTEQVYSGSYSGRMSSRSYTWQGPARDLAALCTSGRTYNFRCYVRMASTNDTVYLTLCKQDDSNGGNATYTTIASGSATTSGWLELSGCYDLTITGTLDKLSLYAQTDSTITDFYVDQMEVLESPVNGGFESGDTTNWGTSGCSQSASTVQKHWGIYSGLTSSRTNATSGPTFDVSTLMTHGKTYEVSCWIRMKTGDGSAKVQLNILQNDDVRNDIRCLKEAYVSDSEWIQLKGVVNPILSGTLNSHRIIISGPTSDKNYYVDDLYITEIKDIYIAQSNRITQFRQADVVITCNNDQGQPLDNASVRIIQKNKSFPFGSAILNPAINNQRYQNFFRQNFNYAAIADIANWPVNEDIQDVKAYGAADAVLDWTEANNIRSRWTGVFWGVDCIYGSNIQGWLKSLTGTQVQSKMQERIDDVVGQYKSRIDNWTVMNESLYDGSSTYGGYDCTWFARKTENQNTDADMYIAVRNSDNYTRPLLVNNFNIINIGQHIPYLKNHVESLISNGAPIDAIGVQSHMSESPSITTHLPRFDSVAQMGLPIWVTEYDYAVANETERANALEKYTTLAYSQPYVKGFIMWHFWEPCMWQTNSYLVSTDWTVNAAGIRWQSMMNQWMTVTTKTTGSDGKIAFRGYYGDYSIIVTPSGGNAQEFPITVSESSIIANSPLQEFTVQLGNGVAEDISAPSPSSFATVPYALDDQAIKMVASTATDSAGNSVEYYFQCTAGSGGKDSGWQQSPVYVDYGLSANAQYTYRVKVRDCSINHNETAYSGTASATTMNIITNKLQNAGFEWGDYAGWKMWGNTGYFTVRTFDTSITRSGSYSMKLDNRPATSTGVDQDLSLDSGTAYKCSAYARMDTTGNDTVNLGIAQSVGSPETIKNFTIASSSSVGNGSWTQLKGVFPYDGTSNYVSYRIDGPSVGRVFYVDDCSVTPIINKVTSNSGFEDGNTTGWATTGNGILSASSTEAHTGTYSCLTSNRSYSWAGPYRNLIGSLTTGKTYDFNCWVKMANTNDTVYLTLFKQDDSNGGNPTYTTISSGSATTSGWLNLSGTQSITITGTLDNLGVYIQTGSTTTDFYMDNLIVEEQ